MLNFPITGRWQRVINRTLFWVSRMMMLWFFIDLAEGFSPGPPGSGTIYVLSMMLLYSLEYITRT